MDIEHAFDTFLGGSDNREITLTAKNDTFPTEPDQFDIFGGSNLGTNKAANSEREYYLAGKYPIKKDQTPLGWCRVCLVSLFFLLHIELR